VAPPIHSLELKKVIRIFLDEIRKTYRLDSAYLFGSHAKGTSNQWSDIDLVVALALTFHGGAGEFGDRRDTGEITYGGIDFWDALTRQRTDGALVRLITLVYPGEDVAQAEQRLTAFTQAIVPVLNEYLPK
jgi:hypothetical protein